MNVINLQVEKVEKVEESVVQLVRVVSYPQSKKYHILGASANLLGICFVLITGLSITNLNVKTYADEICLFASFLFLSSCLLSYLSIRRENSRYDYENWADRSFMIGILSLFAAICTFTIAW